MWLTLSCGADTYVVNANAIAYFSRDGKGAWINFNGLSASGRISLRVDQSFEALSTMLAARTVTKAA